MKTKLIILVLILWAYVIHAQAPQTQATRTTTAAPTYTNNTYNPLSTDTSGNLRTAISATVTIGTSGLATSANQTTGNTSLATIAGAVSGTEMQVDIVSGSVGVTGTVTVNTSNLATSALQTTGNTSLATLAGAVSGTEMQVDVLTVPANQSVNVNQVSGAATSASNPLFVRLTDGTDANIITTGGFVQTDLSSVNQANVLVGNGVTGTGSQRVTIASDNTAFTVNVGTFPDNEPFNLAQAGGTALVTAVTAGTVPVTPAVVEANPPSATAATYRMLSMTTAGAIRQEPVPSGVTAYSAATSMALAASATDFWTITGSATCTVFVTSIEVTSLQTTFAQEEVILVKRSTADSGGSSTAVTAVPHDSNNAAATATVLAYTANPTLGTLVGNLVVRMIAVPASNSQGGNLAPNQFVPQDPTTQPFVLRGTAEQLALNYEAATVAGEAFRVTARWREVCP